MKAFPHSISPLMHYASVTSAAMLGSIVGESAATVVKAILAAAQKLVANHDSGSADQEPDRKPGNRLGSAVSYGCSLSGGLEAMCSA
jgi:hypothetical protein